MRLTRPEDSDFRGSVRSITVVGGSEKEGRRRRSPINGQKSCGPCTKVHPLNMVPSGSFFGWPTG